MKRLWVEPLRVLVNTTTHASVVRRDCGALIDLCLSLPIRIIVRVLWTDYATPATLLFVVMALTLSSAQTYAPQVRITVPSLEVYRRIQTSLVLGLVQSYPLQM